MSLNLFNRHDFKQKDNHISKSLTSKNSENEFIVC